MWSLRAAVALHGWEQLGLWPGWHVRSGEWEEAGDFYQLRRCEDRLVVETELQEKHNKDAKQFAVSLFLLCVSIQ